MFPPQTTYDMNFSNTVMTTKRPDTPATSKPVNWSLKTTGGLDLPNTSKSTLKDAPFANKTRQTHTPPFLHSPPSAPLALALSNRSPVT